jgi:hypothetical protein
MARPAGTLQTYQAVGNREDLSDIIFDISPTETPFVSSIAKIKAKARLHEWQTDALDSAGANSQIEGDDATTNTAVPTIRLTNYCQILSKTARVSGTQEAVDKAGRAGEMAYQVRKRMEEIKRDLEYAAVRNQASSAGSEAVASRMAGVESWIATNKTSVGAASGSAPVTTPGFSSGAVASPTDSTAAGTVTEAALKAVLQAVWTAGGDPKVLMVGPATKSRVSTSFAGIATRYRDANKNGGTAIVSGVDLYISDFGEHKIVPNRFSRDQNILCLDMEYWALAQLRPLKATELAKTGDSERKQLIMEATLVSRNEKASGKVTDINPALVPN